MYDITLKYFVRILTREIGLKLDFVLTENECHRMLTDVSEYELNLIFRRFWQKRWIQLTLKFLAFSTPETTVHYSNAVRGRIRFCPYPNTRRQLNTNGWLINMCWKIVVRVYEKKKMFVSRAQTVCRVNDTRLSITNRIVVVLFRNK